MDQETGAIVSECTRQKKNYEILLHVSAVHFGDDLGEEVVAGDQSAAKLDAFHTSIYKQNPPRRRSVHLLLASPSVWRTCDFKTQRERLVAKIGSTSTWLVFQNQPGLWEPDP